ncbi:uncharacterized protein DDB_G0287625-like [Contarinia nasturtii]|uniref:uncharacterized protein DDB_G0287625-like n=1 Tax=Contarinia nasturtii TaxID=265458 RepID=UPI0012D47933|nr:uncharacterized protein DDB_G0287625-like [Contarinia nasturtii]
MAKKLKSVNASHPSTSSSSNAFAYKNFNSTSGGGKRRKNRKKYFEHDTRTRTIRTTTVANPSAGTTTAAIKKIKFNNEIRIFETKNDHIDVTTIQTPTAKKKKPFKTIGCTIGQKKRSTFRMRRNANNASNNATATSIQTTTKKLQKQLIETQKKLQKQLNALQDQNHSFLALLHSNCMHKNDSGAVNTATTATNATSSLIYDNNNDYNDDDGGGRGTHNDHTHNSHVNLNAIQKLPNTIGVGHSNQNLLCSEQFYKIFTDQSKCSIDKMANGNKATTIRAFTCESKSKNCSVSTDPEAKNHTSLSPNDLCNHHCNNCIENAKSYTSTGIGQTIANIKRPKIHIKKPLLKSIILSTNNHNTNNNQSPIAVNIKQEIDEHSECEVIHFTKGPLQPISDCGGECSATKSPISTKFQHEMQYSDTKKTKQINSYFKSNDFVQQNARSYSPPLPVTHRLTSMVSNDSTLTNTITNNNNNNNNLSRRSNTSREGKSSKRRKKHRRSYSRESRSKSRSYSRSRSSSRSKSRSTSRSHRRRSSRSRSSSFDENARRYSQERKKKSHSKNRDVFRRSSKRDDRNCGCSCNCVNYCKKSSKQHMSKNNSKSPTNDCAFSSKQSNISPSDSKNNKRLTTTTSSDNANGSSTSKKKPITMSSGVLLKQQPIVKLHASPATGSDTENEIDDKFDRKYEELLTFETNEDERREQRLLKALSDIAAKAKQKIQSISSDSSVAKSVHADRNHNDRSATKSNKSFKHNTIKKTNELRDERRSERQTSVDADYSPRERKNSKREPSRRSRRESSYSSSSSKEEKSTRSSRSPSIPRRRGSPSFLDRRRITSARKKPIPYQRSSPYDSYDERDSS